MGLLDEPPNAWSTMVYDFANDWMNVLNDEEMVPNYSLDDMKLQDEEENLTVKEIPVEHQPADELIDVQKDKTTLLQEHVKTNTSKFEKSDYNRLFGLVSILNVDLYSTPAEIKEAWFIASIPFINGLVDEDKNVFLDDCVGVLKDNVVDGQHQLDSEGGGRNPESNNVKQPANVSIVELFAKVRALRQEVALIKELNKGTIEFHVCVGAGMSSTDANNRRNLTKEWCGSCKVMDDIFLGHGIIRNGVLITSPPNGTCFFIKLDPELLELPEENAKFDPFKALGWHLEEIHVTWVHLGKKRTRLQLYTNVNEENTRTIEQSAGGKLHDKNTVESWALLEDLTLYDNKSWNDPRDFAKPVKEISLPQDVPSTSDHRLVELENQVQRLMEAHLAPKSSVEKKAKRRLGGYKPVIEEDESWDIKQDDLDDRTCGETKEVEESEKESKESEEDVDEELEEKEEDDP
nr:hypothetical protein [Tanacetum cinerariifolium]